MHHHTQSSLFRIWRVLSISFLDTGLNPDPAAGVSAFDTDLEHKEPSSSHVGLIEGPSALFPSADDDIW